MRSKKKKHSRKGKCGGASSVVPMSPAASEHSRDELLGEYSGAVKGARGAGSKRKQRRVYGKKKKKSKSYIVDGELNEEINDDDCGVVGDEEADEITDVECEVEVPNVEEHEDDGHGGIEEEACLDLTVYFGDDAKEDDCEIEDDIGDDWDDDKIPDPLSSDDEYEAQSIPAIPYRENVDPEALLALGKTFSSAEDFKHALLRYTLKTRYNIKLYRSTALKLGAKCGDKNSSCPWRVYCSYEKRKQKLMIKCYVSEHECEITGYSKFLKSSAIAMLFSERLRLNPKITKYEMADEIQREYSMFVSVEACGNAKTKIMKERKASHEEHFNKIWDYQAEIFRSNPGSTMDIETIPGPTIGSKQRFSRLYVCFHAQKETWKSTCRPIIGLDGAFLKWDIKGHLLAVVGHDGDNRIVPIAWAVVEIENDTNWDWFVRHLTNDLGLGDGKNFTILSDKQKGLVKAFHTILPEAEHRQCCRHIYDNWKKGPHDLKLQRLFWKVARSYTPGDFKMWMEELQKYNPGAYATLLVTKPETWSRAYFKIGSLCNDNLNNLSESFNRTIEAARRKPLLEMLETIRRQCMVRNSRRYDMANRRKTFFTKRTHLEIDRIELKSKECHSFPAVGPVTEVVHEGVAYSVDMSNLVCGCIQWQMTGIPCIHATFVILKEGKKVSDFVPPCYTVAMWRQTYSMGIRPVQGRKLWLDTNRLGVLPPPWRKGNPGRPKNHDRFKSQNETVSGSNNTKLTRANRVITCSNCKQDGHNKATCKNEFVESQPKKPRGRPRKNQESEEVASRTCAQTSSSRAQESTSTAPGQSIGTRPQGSQRWEEALRAQPSSQTQPSSQSTGWGRWFD